MRHTIVIVVVLFTISVLYNVAKWLILGGAS